MGPSEPKGLCSSCNRAIELNAAICSYCGAPLNNDQTAPDSHRIMHNQSAPHDRSAFSSIPEQRIRERAYEIYVLRGARDGHADGDWFTAEAELKELKKKAAAVLSTIESLTKEA